MLKEIRALWRDGSVMHDVVEKMAQMVSDAYYVYSHSWEVCKGQAVLAETGPVVKDRDKAVNRAEREIRRLIAEHLNLNPGQDVAGCLAVMLMAKDVERIGDHGRNIFGVASRLEGRTRELRFFGTLDALHSRIGDQFPKLERAIRSSDDELARAILSDYQTIKTDCRALREQLYESDLQGAEAVASALLMRYHMRINAHMGNAASGVIFPLENIDFVSRGLRHEEKDR